MAYTRHLGKLVVWGPAFSAHMLALSRYCEPASSISRQMAPVAAVGPPAIGGPLMLPRILRPGRPTHRCLFRGRASGPLPPNVCHPGPGRHAPALPAVAPVTGVAGAGTRDTPAMPPLSHDGLGRGLLRCPLAGKRYTAQSFNPVKGTGTYFRL